MNNFGRFSLLRKSILSATHPSPNGDTFPHKGRLTDLQLLDVASCFEVGAFLNLLKVRDLYIAKIQGMLFEASPVKKLFLFLLFLHFLKNSSEKLVGACFCKLFGFCLGFSLCFSFFFSFSFCFCLFI